MQAFQPTNTQMTSAYYQYQVDFFALQPNTEYSYSISVSGQDLAADAKEYKFRTAPRGGMA
jgi:hypothetical protein